MINIAQPIIGRAEREAVNQVIKSGRLAQGPKVAELEEKFAEYCGSGYAVAANSGTAALHMALHAVSVNSGDEVITTPFSFIATVNTILMQGARPVLVDIEPDSFNIDMSQVEAKITSKTRAVVPIDLYGQPYDFKRLRPIANRHKLAIIEDAAQSVGATYSGKKTGTLGDLGCFSLYATKNIMSGEGGVVVTDAAEYVARMKRFRQHGMIAMNNTYEYVELGYNYRMSDLHAAIAIEQLKKTARFNEARQKNAARLDKGLTNLPGLVTPKVKPNCSHVYHQYTVRITDKFPLSRDELAQKMLDAGVGVAIYYPKPLHAYRHIAKLGYRLGDFPEAERAASEVLSLPVHPKVSSNDISKIIKLIKRAANGQK